MARKRLNPSIKRSRTRSGCLTCRDRHMKCDEQQPVCRNCIKSKRKCYRGIRLNFTQYTIYNPEENPLREVIPQPPEPVSTRSSASQEFQLLDQSITIASLYKSGKQSYEPYLHLHTAEDLTESDLQYQRDTASHSSALQRSASGANVSELESEAPAPTSTAHPSSPPPIQPDSTSFDNNTIHENYDITNLLLSNSYYINQNATGLYTNSPPGAPLSEERSTSRNQPLQDSQPQAQPQVQPEDHQHHFKPDIQEQQPREVGRPHIDTYAASPTHEGHSQTQTSSEALLAHSHPTPGYQNPLPISHSESSSSFRYLWSDHTQSISAQANDQINVQDYVRLIESERFYWILDLFNDLNIWKSVIPSICLRELDSGEANNTFLINCLLNCSVYTNIDFVELLLQQRQEWYFARAIPTVEPNHLKVYENLLISITLILLGVHLKLNRNECTYFTKVVLNNQIKIFNRVLSKLNGLLNSTKFHSILLINSIQSIIILKYILIKKFAFEVEPESESESTNLLPDQAIQFADPFGSSSGIETRQSSIKKEDSEEPLEEQEGQSETANSDREEEIQEVRDEDLDEEIIYPNPIESSQQFSDPSSKGDNTELKEFLELTQFEIFHLNNSFKRFDIPQTALAASSINHDVTPKSDAKKLREYIWYLIKLNYVIRHPNCKQINIDYNFIFQQQNMILPSMDRYNPQHESLSSILEDRTSGTSNPNHRLALPNERGVAINILREFISKLINFNDGKSVSDSNYKIESMFGLIEKSMVERATKISWRASFDWTLTSISNDEYDFITGKRKETPSHQIPY